VYDGECGITGDDESDGESDDEDLRRRGAGSAGDSRPRRLSSLPPSARGHRLGTSESESASSGSLSRLPEREKGRWERKPRAERGRVARVAAAAAMPPPVAVPPPSSSSPLSSLGAAAVAVDVECRDLWLENDGFMARGWSKRAASRMVHGDNGGFEFVEATLLGKSHEAKVGVQVS
jgi:hypothetical protein